MKWREELVLARLKSEFDTKVVLTVTTHANGRMGLPTDPYLKLVTK
jgi:hypothetical protein